MTLGKSLSLSLLVCKMEATDLHVWVLVGLHGLLTYASFPAILIIFMVILAASETI